MTAATFGGARRLAAIGGRGGVASSVLCWDIFGSSPCEPAGMAQATTVHVAQSIKLIFIRIGVNQKPVIAALMCDGVRALAQSAQK